MGTRGDLRKNFLKREFDVESLRSCEESRNIEEFIKKSTKLISISIILSRHQQRHFHDQEEFGFESRI